MVAFLQQDLEDFDQNATPMLHANKK